MVEELTVGYRWKRVVQGANLRAGRGELVYIWGPPESGKSTLLKGIVGRAKVFSGKRSFNGVPLRGLSPERMTGLGLILIPQKGGYFEGLKVSEHFKLAAGSEDPPERVGRLMDELSVSFDPDKKVRKLDLLDKRLLALFVVLTLDPKLVMYDEPFEGLEEREKMVKAILLARERLGPAFLIASRTAPALLGIRPDRLYFMKSGLLTASPSSSSS